MDYFASEFGFSALEATALMGAHTLGGANILDSGYHGIWVRNEAGVFNNRYYSNMVDQPWTLTQRKGSFQQKKIEFSIGGPYPPIHPCLNVFLGHKKSLIENVNFLSYFPPTP